MSEQLVGLSSMATKGLLVELTDVVSRRLPVSVRVESAGGTEVVENIRAGVLADFAVLGAAQMSALDADGLLRAGTLRPLFVSDVVAAVPATRASTPFTTEADLRAALAGATRIAYSSGPSGAALLDLVRRWGLDHVVRPKLVRAPPGTPVGNLLAGGEADLGFQQRSELADVAGIALLGPLPGAAAIRSTFSGAVLARSAHSAAAGAVIEFFASDAARANVLAGGMATG